MPEFTLYARQRAAQEEAAKDQLRAWLVWLLIILEATSMLCFIQVATLTHGVFTLIPLVGLCVAAALRLHSRPHILLAEPLCVVWPDNHSRHRLARKQMSQIGFVMYVWLLKLVCCMSFWASGASISLMTDLCPDSVPMPNCSHYNRPDGYQLCVNIHLFDEPPNAKRKDLYSKPGDACWEDCSPCKPELVLAWEPPGIQLGCRLSTCSGYCCQCLNCQLSPSLPNWLKQGCSSGAFAPGLAPELYKCHDDCPLIRPKPLPYYQGQTWSSQNTMLAQLSRCTLTEGKHEGQVQIALAVIAAYQCLPLVALVTSLLLSVAWSLLRGESVFSMVGGAPADLEALEAIDTNTERLRDQIARGRLQASTKVKLQLWMEFVLFLLDYFSDYNCLLQFFLQGAYPLAAVQACIIAAPVALDFYRGKIQLIEVIGGFNDSRRRGFPTNKFIRALRSEKSVEAPFSMFLQYYTLLRTTSLVAVWSLCFSLLLSLLGIARHAYGTFELQVLDVLAPTQTGPGQPEESRALAVPAQPVYPQYPPGLVPERMGPHLSPDMPALPLPPGIAQPCSMLPPITMGNQKVKETE